MPRKTNAKTLKVRAEREAALEEAMDVVPVDGKRKAATPAKGAAAARQDAQAGVSTAAGEEEEGNVVYVGHVPHGFYEDQMKGFFSQFGEVTRLKLSRNKKTGASKHYAFVEFKFPSVAKIVAETMNNYLMFDKVLKVHVVPPSEVHKDTFKGTDKPFKPVNFKAIAKAQVNKERTPEEYAAMAANIIRTERKRRRKIAEAGIDYEFPGFESSLPARSKKTKFEDK